VRVNNLKKLIKLDTGAQLNFMPLNKIDKLNTKLEKSSVVIKSFGGFQIKSLGKIKVNIKNSKKEIVTYFEVVEFNVLPILGLHDCIKLESNMNEVNEIKDDVSDKDNFIKFNIDVFSGGLGEFPEKITINLKDNALPKAFPPRRVPYKIINKLKETLEIMCKLKVIEKCNEASEWQSPIIIVEKPSKSIRVFLDPREPNKNIIRETFQIQTLEEIKLDLCNKKIFILLDLKDGFHQCKLEKNSLKYCCFSTPFGS